MVTAIQADPEVAFLKLPNKEFFMFYFIASKSDKMYYKLYLSIMNKLLRILFLHFCCKIIYSL